MNNAVEQLQGCLEQELGLTTQFLCVLQAESAALAAADGIDALAESTSQKNQMAELLSRTGQTRETLLTTLGYSADKSGLDAAANTYPELQATWQDLLARATEARQLNSSNGVVIDTYLKHNQQALMALRTLAGAGNLYDARGRTKNRPDSGKRSIKAG